MSDGKPIEIDGINTIINGDSLEVIKTLPDNSINCCVTSPPYKEAHFAVFPPDLIKPMILAGCPTGGVVLDPFVGSGTTAIVARELGRRFIGIELNPEYAGMASRRVGQTTPCLFEAVEVML